jgi:hypothetical protein
MLKALNAALIALSLICPGIADAQGQPAPDAVAAATELIIVMRGHKRIARSCER